MIAPPAPRAADEIATLTDSGGASVSLKTFNVELAEGQGDLAHQGSWSGYDVIHSVPIREKSGVVRAVPIDRVERVEMSAGDVTITSTGGERVSGRPLPECSFTGESALGNVSIPAAKVLRIELDSLKVKNYLKKNELTPGDDFFESGWDKGAGGTLVLRSGEAITLSKVSLIYQVSGCSDSYIPCKPWTAWRVSTRVPVMRGEFATEVRLARADHLEFKPGEPIVVAATLQNGQTVEGQLKLGDGVLPSTDDDVDSISDSESVDRLVGVVGTASLGNVHVPIAIVQSITFKTTHGEQPKK